VLRVGFLGSIYLGYPEVHRRKEGSRHAEYGVCDGLNMARLQLRNKDIDLINPSAQTLSD